MIMKTIRIYLAGMWSRKMELLDYAKQIEDLGYSVMASWLFSEDDDDGYYSREKYAEQDYNDVLNSDLVIVFNQPLGSFNSGGGRHTELGFAIALRKEVWCIGGKEQIFHHLPQIIHFEKFEDCLEELRPK